MADRASMKVSKGRSRMGVAADVKKRAAEIARQLGLLYPDATCSLDFRTPLELLVATILAAQCTDERVNLVTNRLFRKYRKAADYAKADPAEFEQEIRSTGFFRNKAKSILGCAKQLMEEHGGKVPAELDALVRLPGVGRKTANVVLGTAFGIASGVVVDTHMTRLSQRMGLTAQKDPEKIEHDLMALLPAEEWVNFGHRMVFHGRQVCMARNPQCDSCPLARWCPKIGVAKKK